jgi:hypothetical protein
MDTNRHECGRSALDQVWSAVTCHRFGRLADLSAKQSRVQRLGAMPRASRFDGDKSPAKSADKSAHSKAMRLCRAVFIRVRSCSFVVNSLIP